MLIVSSSYSACYAHRRNKLLLNTLLIRHYHYYLKIDAHFTLAENRFVTGTTITPNTNSPAIDKHSLTSSQFDYLAKMNTIASYK